MDVLVHIVFENSIHLCSLVTSLGDSLQTIAIVNVWIFDANVKKIIKLLQQPLDESCKHNLIKTSYVTTKLI